MSLFLNSVIVTYRISTVTVDSVLCVGLLMQLLGEHDMQSTFIYFYTC